MSQLPGKNQRLGLSGRVRRIQLLIILTFSFFITKGQHIGVNTTTPNAGLHVVSDDGILATGTFGQGIVQDSGAGTKLMWIPKLAAFRVGGINAEGNGFFTGRWDPDSIGEYSFAGGVNSMANGNFSFSYGNRNIASGDFSSAIGGFENVASGQYSFATGLGNSAPSGYESVIGSYATLYTPVSPSGFHALDRVFTIGAGLDLSHRFNAMTVLKSGRVGINTSLPLYPLHVHGESAIDSGRLVFVNTGNSILIGHEAGLNDDHTDNKNILIGNTAGRNMINGSQNIGIGTGALNNGGNNFDNIAIGTNVLTSSLSGSENVGVGTKALEFNSSGAGNAAFGTFALKSNTSGHHNVAVGQAALFNNASGFNNVAIGSGALYINHDQTGNLAIGQNAGNYNLGSYNTFLGNESGTYNVTGHHNVYIGNQSGQEDTTSFKLIIDVTNTTSPLIYGDFAKNKVFINDSLGSKYFQMTNGSGTDKVLTSDANGNGKWTAPSAIFMQSWTLDGDNIYNNNSEAVGIGTNTPQEKLHVAGNVLVNGYLKTSSFRMTSGSGDNYILRSDSEGNGTWVVPNTIFSDDWSANGNKIYNSNTGNVGIGTLNPTEKLQVDGNLKINGGKISFESTGFGTFVGKSAGINDLVDNLNANTFIGFEAGMTNTAGAENTALGGGALKFNLTGNQNTALGNGTMASITTGAYNLAAGYGSLNESVIGSNNIGLGYFALKKNNGSGNVSIGQETGAMNTTGSSNVFIGAYAGEQNTGSGSVFLGSNAGKLETGSNKLYISNSQTTTPLVYGDFSAKKLTVNDSLSTKQIELNGGRLSYANTGQSVFVGNKAGLYDDHSANVNIFVGEQAGKVNTTGENDIAIGAFAMDGSTTSSNNIAIGKDALGSASFSGSTNIAVGHFSLSSNTSGGDNVGIGQNALSANTNAIRNVSVGNYSMDANTQGSFNTAMGHEALGSSVAGEANVAFGVFAGYSSTGNNNTFIGATSGYSNTGSGNIFLGHEAGFNETGSNKLYIENSSSDIPLIYGDFSTNEVTINDSLTVGKELGIATSTPNSTLEVNGSVAAKFNSGLTAGTTQPDGTGTVWRYSTGTGSITLPSAASCPNRMYIIINQTGTPRTISSYRDLTTTPQTSINSSVALWIMSDGSLWYQIK